MTEELDSRDEWLEDTWSTCRFRGVTEAMGVRKCEGINGPERSKGCEDTYVNVVDRFAPEFSGNSSLQFFIS
jgi:hypothetical protein